MIRSFRHKGLRRLFEEDDGRGLNRAYVDKIQRILARLDAAKEIADMDLPAYRLHALKGDFQGFYSIAVSGNWRIVFRFEQGEALNVDLLDYH